MPLKIRCKEIVIRDISGKGRRDDSLPPQFGNDKMFTNLSRELSSVASVHLINSPGNEKLTQSGPAGCDRVEQRVSVSFINVLVSCCAMTYVFR